MKSFKNYIIDEALDYKAENCDGACDRRSDYFKECMKVLKEHVSRLREDQEKYKDDEDYCKGAWDYTLIGMINPILKMFVDSHNEYYIDNEILGILEDAINNTFSDFKFHEGWKDGPEKLDKQLEQYKNQVKKYRKQVQKLHDDFKINYDTVNGVLVGASGVSNK